MSSIPSPRKAKAKACFDKVPSRAPSEPAQMPLKPELPWALFRDSEADGDESPIISASDPSSYHEPRCKTMSFPSLLVARRSPSMTTARRRSGSIFAPAWYVLASMTSTMRSVCASDSCATTGSLLSTERIKERSRQPVRSSPKTSLNCGMPMQTSSHLVSATTVVDRFVLWSAVRAASPKTSPPRSLAILSPPVSTPLSSTDPPRTTDNSPFLTM
mmetsp:Transcript_33735/g.98156  ORF Transcript_33735/g.98156 Transcript_33735/m.98156 type:complete len:216 (+) Transcript_33735:2042-2689(+)